MTDRKISCACALGLVAGLGVSMASADLTDEVFVLGANVGSQHGSFIAHVDDGYFDGHGNFYWELNTAQDIYSDSGEYLATLSAATLVIFQDPMVNVNFNVQASNQNTVFTVESGLLSFSPIATPIGTASAGVSVTDVNGDGATLTPDASSIYAAHYNGNYPSGTPFANLLANPVSAGAFQTNSASDEYPGGGGWVGIGESVESMSAAWTFTLSPYDIASGTSTFIVVPAPAGAGLLGLAGLAVIRRRR